VGRKPSHKTKSRPGKGGSFVILKHEQDLHIMHTATQSSPSYDFRKDFDSIARPGVIRYLKHLGYGVDLDEGDDPNDFDLTYYTDAKRYSRQLRRALEEAQEFYEQGGSHPCYPEITTWSLESAVELANTRLEDMLGATEDGPIDLYRAVYLGTKMAREQGIEVGTEAVAYAADRLKSKLERDAVYNPVTEVHGGILSYRFLKEQHGGKVVYIDHYKRRRPEPATSPKADDDLPIFNMGEIADDDTIRFEFVVPNMVEDEQVTIIAGEGGVGKTILLMQLGAAVSHKALDTKWIGMEVAKGPVLLYTAEEPTKSLRIRRRNVCNAMKIGAGRTWRLSRCYDGG
jgi:AAA domain